jgi:hypothetical protein
MSIRTERDENDCEFQFAKLKNDSRVPILYSSGSPLLRKEGKTCSHTQVFAVATSGKRAKRVLCKETILCYLSSENLHTGFPIKHTSVIGKSVITGMKGSQPSIFHRKFKILHLSLVGVSHPKERKSHMNTAISTLEIPQEATELTLNELKLICGGWDDDGDGCERARRRRRFKLEKVIVIKVFKRKKPFDGCDEDGDDDN